MFKLGNRSSFFFGLNLKLCKEALLEVTLLGLHFSHLLLKKLKDLDLIGNLLLLDLVDLVLLVAKDFVDLADGTIKRSLHVLTILAGGYLIDLDRALILFNELALDIAMGFLNLRLNLLLEGLHFGGDVALHLGNALLHVVLFGGLNLCLLNDNEILRLLE
jgi:hypothetical protein